MIPTLTGYSLVFIPRSWALGVWHKRKKVIYALGPFRYVVHYGLGQWKDDAYPPEPSIERGVWLHGASPSERLTGHDGGPTNVKAGGALEPKVYERKGINGGARSGELGFDG